MNIFDRKGKRSKLRVAIIVVAAVLVYGSIPAFVDKVAPCVHELGCY